MAPIIVTAAIIENAGKYLIARRKKGSHLENKWEFPGGKVESDESPEDCLVRELEEEFAIKAEVEGFFAESRFDYDEKSIILLGYRVKHLSGQFKLNAHQEIKWVSHKELQDYDFAAADIPIVRTLQNGY